MPIQIKLLPQACAAYAALAEEILALGKQRDVKSAEFEKLKDTTALDDEAGRRRLGELSTDLLLLPAAIARREKELPRLIDAVAEAWKTETMGLQHLIRDKHQNAVDQIAALLSPFFGSDPAGDQEARKLAAEFPVVMALRSVIPVLDHAAFRKGGSTPSDPMTAAATALALIEQYEAASLAFDEAMKSLARHIPKN